MPAARLSERVTTRLAEAEVSELNPHYRDDLRIARLTVAHAARGDAVLCSPHVLASYEVLGLHPEKVWPKIEARRMALGPLQEMPVLKKPAQSVSLWCEKTNAARTAILGGGETLLRNNTISVPMAAPSIAAAYPNSDHSGSGKERPFFKREEIQEFFENCPPDLVSSPELRTVFGMWKAAGKPFGSDIQFFKAIQDYCEGALPQYKSQSAVRSNIRRAEDSGILEVAYRDRRGNCHHIWIRERTDADQGLYRRVITHRLSIPLLLKWRHRKEEAKVQPIRQRAQSAPDNRREPQSEKAAAEHRSPERSGVGRSLTQRQRKELAARIAVYQRGNTAIVDVNGYTVRHLQPGDPSYVKPLPHEMAVLAACKSMCQGDLARGFESHGCAIQRALDAVREMEASP